MLFRSWSLFGIENLSFNFSAGSILWPIVFIMTDIINEYYGRRGVRMLSYMAAGLIAYGFLMLFFAMKLTPAEFWRTSHLSSPNVSEQVKAAVTDFDAAYRLVFGQSLWIIAGSLTSLALTLLPELAREFSEYRMLVFGLVMVLMMIWRPQGLLPASRPRLELPQ